MAGRTVAIIDDHASVRDALCEMLGIFGFVVERHESAIGFVERSDIDMPGCIVTDVRMPGMDGIELVRTLKARGLDVPIILISGHADVQMAVAGIKAGANDFLEKPLDDVQLVAAINRALASGFDADRALAGTNELRERFGRLTARQAEVFDLVVQGYSSSAIASILAISRRTVESYRSEVMERMQAASVAILVRQAIRLGRLNP